jgi:hypothetical protein
MGRLPQKAETHPRQINNENYQRAATAVEPTTKSSLFEVPIKYRSMWEDISTQLRPGGSYLQVPHPDQTASNCREQNGSDCSDNRAVFIDETSRAVERQSTLHEEEKVCWLLLGGACCFVLSFAFLK